MRTSGTNILAAAGLLLTSPAIAQPSQTAAIVSQGGAAGGTVTLTDAPRGVLLRIEATGLTPGWHAVHFHEKAVCNDEGFKLSGAHVHSATPAVHGLLNPAMTEFGDLPNIFAAADGTAHAEIFTPLVSMTGAGGRPALADADGSALVIHAAADDYHSQPIGGAGARIACAMIR
jgi:superoxide dismutase, Cu-Zn family